MSSQVISKPEPKTDDLTGPRYWRSLDDLVSTPSFKEWVEREFPQGAELMEGVNRRSFMKVMAASFGLAGIGLAGCRRPKMHVLPYAQQPENVIPGVATYYSSSFPDAISNIPLIVETHGSRPTKVEGNPSFPHFGGGTNTFAQASVLDLYDVDRSTQSRDLQGNQVGLTDLLDRLSGLHGKLRLNRGKGFAFLVEGSSSPTRLRMAQTLTKQYPNATWAEYNAVDYGNPERSLKNLTGRSLRPIYHFSKAKRVLSLDGDFLDKEPGSLAYTRYFTGNRKIKNAKDAGRMNRLYVVESNMTLTGGMADHRMRLSSSQVSAFTALMTAEVLKLSGGDARLIEVLEEKGSALQVDSHWIEECAKDLFEHQGYSIVFPGSHQSEEVHLLTAVLNEALAGESVEYLELPENPATTIDVLATQIEAGDIHTLVIIGGNPVYNAPAGLKWAALQESVDEVVRFGYHYDETSAKATLHVAASHYLESWSDGRTLDGVVVPVQPVIEPLFDTIGEIELIARILGELETNPYNQVRLTFDKLQTRGNVDQAFNRFLAEGVLEDSEFAVAKVRFLERNLIDTVLDFQLRPPALSGDSIEVRWVSSSSVFDGRYGNNGWLQECPEPMTKLTWDNAIIVSPRLAKKLQAESGYPLIGGEGIMQGGFGERFSIQVRKGVWKRGKEYAPIAELELDGVKVKGPVHVLPGLASYTVILPLGYGRRETGRVGKGAGFDFYPLKQNGVSFKSGGTIRILEDEPSYQLANTQEHWSLEGRAVIREGTTEEYIKTSKQFGEQHGRPGSFVDKMGMESHSPLIYGKNQNDPAEAKRLNQPRGGSLYGHPSFGEPPQYSKTWSKEEHAKDFIPPQQWGMSIDLNMCTGCNACVVACQSENNIPIVGKDQVLRGREMHWIRLDRYFSEQVHSPSYHEAVNGQNGATVNHGAALNDEDPLPVPEDVQVSFQGMACAHCELAPCESVCPVNATVHDNQGLNTMAYNRCVGTRYCANNCPYKVRRFNFFDWNKRDKDEVYLGPLGKKQMDDPHGGLVEMKANPDVTVRMRGVMEKCTYCVQRIEEGKINHKVAMAKAGNMRDVHVPDGQIKVACQQVCPSDAIEFGDTTDPTARVYQAKENDRDYAVLGYLNVRPRTTYLAKLRNPNPHMPDAYTQPFLRQDYEQRFGHGEHHGDEHHEEAAHDAHGDH